MFQIPMDQKEKSFFSKNVEMFAQDNMIGPGQA